VVRERELGIRTDPDATENEEAPKEGADA